MKFSFVTCLYFTQNSLWIIISQWFVENEYIFHRENSSVNLYRFEHSTVVLASRLWYQRHFTNVVRSLKSGLKWKQRCRSMCSSYCTPHRYTKGRLSKSHRNFHRLQLRLLARGNAIYVSNGSHRIPSLKYFSQI